ncbi:hypothetical protein HD554DRAFT_2112825 [Boletus coccyginus]|nr:hypothetical protein HD554DRAFT_2112825 [Boletus coccyginus]
MIATPPPAEQRLIVVSALLFSPEEGIVLTQGLNGEALGFPPQMWYSPTALSACGAPINPAICCSPAPPSTSYQQHPVATPVDAGSPAQRGYTQFPRLPSSRAPQTQPAHSNIDMQYYTQVQQLQGMGQAAQAQAQSQLPTQMTQVAQHPAMPTQYNPPQENAHPYVVTHIPQSQQQDLGTQGQVMDGQQQVMAQYAMCPYPVSYDGRLPAQYAAWAVGAIGHVPDGQTSGM